MDTEVVVFPGFEELDAFGPLNVLAVAGWDVRVVTVDEPAPLTASHGTVVVPTARLSAAPQLIVVPGGGWLDRSPQGTWAEAQRGVVPAALAAAAAAGSLVASVCTGALLLAAAGLLDGRPAVTNQEALEELAAAGAEVDASARVVDDGNVVTSGGLTAGIDLGLWLVERHEGPDRAAEVAHELEYVRQGVVRRSSPVR